jgi:hypothetical protein
MPRINFKHVLCKIVISIVAYWAVICNVISHRGSTTIPQNPARVTLLTDIVIGYYADGKPKA